MYIGSAIALLAIGAILAFAVEFEIAGINISMVGFILMIVGLIGVLLDLAVWGPRRRTTHSGEVVREREVY